ncbi:MAG TPA: PBP1A family penicillin-binding protein, partial [Candidatus Polarisedimenticolaceae bacterium]|nr:PBP1A family penicillin-binding protein [Candidatus Polarisedimenticolaceae bacterium]
MALTFLRSRRRWLILALAFLLVAAGVGLAMGLYLRLDLPAVEALENYTPPLQTRVLAADGVAVGSFGGERRTLVPYERIPDSFRNALVAIEDKDFFRHPGVDLSGIARALWRDIAHMKFEQGASTLTQQLARNLFLTRDKKLRRKVQEAMLAVEIERRYTKQEIFRLYANQVYMGHGRYGVEAAARYYFDKSISDVTLPEAALLAGIIQRPEGLSPFRRPDRALKRRSLVLGRMRDEGYLTPAEADAAMAAPLVLSTQHDADKLAPYFVEEVRRWLQKDFGDAALYEQGLEVRTTLDRRLQAVANDAVDRGLRVLDKRQGWRGAPGKVPQGSDPASYAPPEWKAGVREGDVVLGVVEEVSPSQATVRAGPFTGKLDREGIAWTGKRKVSDAVRRGDLVHVRMDGDTVALEQEPRVEAALVALDPRTGAVLALVGGYDFGRSEFDRAVQALRQTGSAFKPFVYAAAVDAGRTPADTIVDLPVSIEDPQTHVIYEPKNYKGEYHGLITLRKALETSANVAAVKLLTSTGYPPVITLAQRLGIRSDLKPYPSLALGAFEIRLIDLTSAYGAFANGGMHVEPHLVREVLDREGRSMRRIEPQATEALRPETAYVLTRMMEGVITDGTGAAAAGLGRPLAGKTGTTNDHTDAWFVGYSPEIATGVWVGFDQNRLLGRGETGGRAALPIWLEFMQKALADRPVRDFEAPPGIVFARIDTRTG